MTTNNHIHVGKISGKYAGTDDIDIWQTEDGLRAVLNGSPYIDLLTLLNCFEEPKRGRIEDGLQAVLAAGYKARLITAE